MRRLICVLLFVVISATLFAGKDDLLTVTHYSQTLKREKTFCLYVPPDAKPAERFPVLFILHGAYGSYNDWISKTNVLDLAENYRMILVFPDGSEFGWYVDSPVEKDSQYESYVARELVAEIDRLFPTVASREGRGIMGLSMGGHGALLLSAKHPDVFGSASALSGILKITNHPDKWQIAGRLGALDKNRSAWEANSVWEQAERFKEAKVQLLFDCGSSDTLTGAIGDNRELHDRLVELGIPHIWREMPGTHSWDYWQKHLEEHLNFHQAAMVKVTPSSQKWNEHYFKRLAEFFKENGQLNLESPTTGSQVAVPISLCLLGSSSMEGFPADLLPGYRVFNRGISGDTLGIGPRGLSHRLEESVMDPHPNFVFISNGRNDLGNRQRTGEPSIEQMIEQYEKIIREIYARAPQTKIVIVTCAPVRDKYAELAAATHAYNMQLKDLAKKHAIPVIDLYKALVGEDGLLRPEYSRDGLHITKTGYEIWARMIISETKK